MLSPCKQSAEPLESILDMQSDLLRAVKQYRDDWADSYKSASRYLLALHSLRVAVELALSSGTWHVGMVIIRPDLLYHDRLDVELFTRAISLNSVTVPDRRHLSEIRAVCRMPCSNALARVFLILTFPF